MGKKVVILGGGIAGLSAAYQLSKAGYSVTVIEREGQLGGLARTIIKRGGFMFDLGPHRFLNSNPEIFKEIQGLLNNTLKARHRSSKIRLLNKYFEYPFKINDLVRNLDFFILIRALQDYLYAFLKKKLRQRFDKSYEEWVIHRFGRTIYDLYFGPYLTKLLGREPSQIDSTWASQRIPLLNPKNVLKYLLFPDAHVPRSYVSKFHYPEDGIGSISEKFGEIIKSFGNEILLEAEVNKICLHQGIVGKVIYRQHRQNKELSCDYVLSTIPLEHLIFSFWPPPPNDFIQSARRLKYRFLLFVGIALSVENFIHQNWLYFPEKEFVFTRLSFPQTFSPKMVPYGKSFLLAEIPCEQGDERWRSESENIISQVVQQLNQINLLNSVKIEDTFVVKCTHAYPVYELGYKKHRRHLLELVKSIRNLATFGRQGLFIYNNMDHSIEMGFKVAELLKAGCLCYDPENVVPPALRDFI